MIQVTDVLRSVLPGVAHSGNAGLVEIKPGLVYLTDGRQQLRYFGILDQVSTGARFYHLADKAFLVIDRKDQYLRIGEFLV